MLALELDLLCAVYRAALPGASAPEWPPHPERVFSALVQAWADRGCDPEERSALEWLSQQEAPLIEADPSATVAARDAPTVFVPPNDPYGVFVAQFPERLRQARSFAVAVPAVPVVRLFWPDAEPKPAQEAALRHLAKSVASVGHSASLVRAAFRDDLMPEPNRLWLPRSDGAAKLRVPYPGRLECLVSAYGYGDRPPIGVSAAYAQPASPDPAPAPRSWFGSAADWFVFEDDDGPFRPDILGFAHVARRVRHALMSLGPQPAPEIVSGHAPDGSATANPHLAIVPLQNAGWPHADGRLLGFAVVLPRCMESDARAGAVAALAAFAQAGREDASTTVQLSRTHAWQVVRNPAPTRASLRPARWCGTAQVWASAMPMLLDRYPDRNDPAQEAALVAASCTRIGLPAPVEVTILKHSAVTGASDAYPARGRRSLPDWSFPADARFATRPRRHVVLRFAQPVAGPVILGAGRFSGFGLCLPLPDGGEPR